MGESCRHQSPASVSLTLPEEPPHFQASKEPAPSLPSLPNWNIKGCPHSLYHGRAESRGAKTRGQGSLFRTAGTPGEPRAPRLAAAFAGADAQGRSGGIGAPNPAPQVRAADAAPRAASGQSPRPRSHASSSTRSPGCWAAGAGEPGMGAGAARPSIAAAADPGSSTRPSRLGSVENSSLVRTPGRKKRDKILRDSCSPRNRGGLAPYPFYMLRRLPPVRLRTGAPPGAPRERRAAGWKPRRALAEAPGRRECRRGRPLLARSAVRSTRERTTPRAAAALRRPLPARRSTTGRGDPRLQQGEPRGALRLASRPFPGAAPDRSQVSELRIRTLPSNPAGRTAAWWESEHPPTYPSVGKRTALPPVLRPVVLPDPHFGGGGRRERCRARE